MGRRTENLLLDVAEESGFVGIRVDIRGAAGYTSGHDAGDLFIGKQALGGGSMELANSSTIETSSLTKLYIVEEKYSATESMKYIQEDGEKLDRMIEFAEDMGATPVIAVRWSSQVNWSPGAEHYLVDARDVERTSAGNISIKPETAEADFEAADTFFQSSE
jgi:Holliday junction resolvase